METILILLIINYFISRLLVILTKYLSKIYVENSVVLSSTTREELYRFYITVYTNPKCLDNIIILHLPIYNIYQCNTVLVAIINAKIKLNK